MFYAIIDNYGEHTCWPCERAHSFLKQFGFKVVMSKSEGIYKNYAEFAQGILEVYRRVVSSLMSENEEGNVIYLIEKDPSDPKKERVLDLVKFKTLEYQMFREMHTHLGKCIKPKKGKVVSEEATTESI